MKIKLFVLAFVAVFIISACSDDKDDITLSKNKVSLYAEETEKITASESVTWETESEFVAKVKSDGTITGNHVGKTIIVANSKNGSGKCEVEVIPRYNTYTNPVFEFGASKSSIKSKEKRTLDEEDTNSLVYNPENNKIIGVVYSFKDGKLEGIGVGVKYAYSLEATDFLIERYQVVEANKGGIAGYMLNDDPEKATMAITASIEDNFYMIIYLAYPFDNDTRSQNAQDKEAMENKLKEIMRSMNNE